MELEEFKNIFASILSINVEDVIAFGFMPRTLLLAKDGKVNLHIYYDGTYLNRLVYTDNGAVITYKQTKTLNFSQCVPAGVVFPERSDLQFVRLLLIASFPLEFSPYNRDAISIKRYQAPIHEDLVPAEKPADIKTFEESGFVYVSKSKDNLHLLRNTTTNEQSLWMPSKEYGVSRDGYPRLKWKNSLLNFIRILA